jgi:hypothetical protein
MDAEDWLKSVEKKLEIAQCTDHKRCFLWHTSYLELQQIGGRLTVTPTSMLRPSPEMSSRLASGLIMCPAALSN